MVFSKFTQAYGSSNGKNESRKKKNSGSPNPTHVAECPIELSIKIESPPCVLYGNAVDSSGALLAGLLTLKVKKPRSIDQAASAPLRATKSTPSSSLKKSTAGLSNERNSQTSLSRQAQLASMEGKNYKNIKVVAVTLRFVQKVHYHMPFVAESSSIQNCNKCKIKMTELKKWKIQTKMEEKCIGKHIYPYSYLTPGNLPSTSSLGASAMTHIEYELIAIAKYNILNDPETKTLRLNMPIQVTRSILRGPDKNSLRVFPPTELTAAAVLPNVIYPKSSFPLELKLDGVSSGDTRWRMRKLAWRIEETTRVRSNACNDHESQLKKLEESVKQKEIERSKKPIHPIKRYGDVGPQVRVSVSSPENMPLGRMRNVPVGLNDSLNTLSPFTEGPIDPSVSSTARPVSRSQPQAPRDGNSSRQNDVQSRNSRNRDIDDDDNDDNTPFIHPSDDALRQEILQQQHRQREEQMKQEFKNNNSTLFTEEVRIISKGEMKSGWKTDFDQHGKIELVTDIDCMPLTTGVRNPLLYATTAKPIPPQTKPHINLSCDIQDLELGIYVNHILAVEIVVAEETLQYTNGQPVSKTPKSASTSSTSVARDDQRLAELSIMFANQTAWKGRPVEEDGGSLSPSSSNNNSTPKAKTESSVSSKVVSVPTGAARVLRMQFRLNVTERSGLGISWDEEVPPIYQDVKDYQNPPNYENAVAKTPTNSLDSVTSNSSVDDPHREGDIQTVSRNIPGIPTVPQMAHHSNANGHHRNDPKFDPLSSVTSPTLENVISIQGNVPHRGQLLTPATTRNMGMMNHSHLYDSDRITQ
ncbi:similar to Saccharomyces cerevisiae YOR322C LDB19 Protein involved in regulating the endocytosis of plasma membrane proteins by recruiting the ubiquitin ligase Rsp5p to its target [Maudiozyma barnettii]|uniref:Similar to Saccharomyces cerevisiae YOR322C LDB19 Protein involved in regulating the endocytosis of plasma membrane proteins by recruiting the ubiquitin ligase Rsp5p to its target n=1 Tax=Maudiozyma barnettii TaxID=61262 RepID=A0A8H2ZHN3_9SACH|nr:Ldb19p [Kazachstania barnettii]CAB4254118.1 similar to Saccharomyces cerevisiae YOR322C LDB19 Protein involved in regulating the endocytosis of plasma membrane proteins by recruiting the ubiquitin ligase Rsp5p to its target [Kazachstania barnettii]CAD1781868.1 similar to Saccharomyces cerevisiae YOR322C LDB19 Protein involved in regulating the endocytosis of plasma membrane proteins by recruiting the ubiquitin ligase Rsp5p to its target [Kazachstania barnettii]